jgi:tetratricopeptide (TPR) repeat protein
VSLSEQAMLYMAAAVRANGDEVLDADIETGTAAALGQRLLREIFADRAGGQWPGSVQALIADPEDESARAALENQVHDALHYDPRLEAWAGETLTGFLRQEIEAGNTGAMVGLGDLLRSQDDLEGARAAYQRAIDSGDTHAMIDLADLLRGYLGDADGARAWFQRAIDSGDADVALEATVDLGHLLVMFQRDAEGARAAFQRAIDSGHPRWAPAAMVGLAQLLDKLGDTAGARAVCQRAIESGNADAAARASAFLAKLLKKQDGPWGAPAVGP